MKSHTAYLTFNTKARKEIIPITNDVERIIRESGVKEGLALVSAMHLTASVIIGGRGIRPPPRHHGMGRATRTRTSQLSPSPDWPGTTAMPTSKTSCCITRSSYPSRMAGSTLATGLVSSTVNSMGNAPNESSSRSSVCKVAV
jgi:hypothetical protein